MTGRVRNTADSTLERGQRQACKRLARVRVEDLEILFEQYVREMEGRLKRESSGRFLRTSQVHAVGEGDGGHLGVHQRSGRYITAKHGANLRGLSAEFLDAAENEIDTTRPVNHRRSQNPARVAVLGVGLTAPNRGGAVMATTNSKALKTDSLPAVLPNLGFHVLLQGVAGRLSDRLEVARTLPEEQHRLGPQCSTADSNTW